MKIKSLPTFGCPVAPHRSPVTLALVPLVPVAVLVGAAADRLFVGMVVALEIAVAAVVPYLVFTSSRTPQRCACASCVETVAETTGNVTDELLDELFTRHGHGRRRRTKDRRMVTVPAAASQTRALTDEERLGSQILCAGSARKLITEEECGEHPQWLVALYAMMAGRTVMVDPQHAQVLVDLLEPWGVTSSETVDESVGELTEQLLGTLPPAEALETARAATA